MHWNYRLLKEPIKDSKDRDYESIKFIKAFYNDDGTLLNGYADLNINMLIDYAETKDQEGKFDFNKIEYDSIDEVKAKANLKGTLTKLLNALDKPILTLDDLKKSNTFSRKGIKMTVKELIQLLKKQPQDLQVVYSCRSEQCLLEAKEIQVIECCEPRDDGWIQDKRPDKPTQKYLAFPGN